MSEKTPDSPSFTKSSFAKHTLGVQNNFKSEERRPSTTSHESESNVIMSHGRNTQADKLEWVVQEEPGVYISLSSFPAGGNQLKRVRFRYTYCHPSS